MKIRYWGQDKQQQKRGNSKLSVMCKQIFGRCLNWYEKKTSNHLSDESMCRKRVKNVLSVLWCCRLCSCRYECHRFDAAAVVAIAATVGADTAACWCPNMFEYSNRIIFPRYSKKKYFFLSSGDGKRIMGHQPLFFVSLETYSMLIWHVATPNFHKQLWIFVVAVVISFLAFQLKQIGWCITNEGKEQSK